VNYECRHRKKKRRRRKIANIGRGPVARDKGSKYMPSHCIAGYPSKRNH